ncbi:MAG: hypothetical protein O7C56_09720 [Rickettsia endosymbiont of Ixodes persulcatus]|nr:hypothetical protein [Rickettsia endosymbiont of Ixodes persulcatus]
MQTKKYFKVPIIVFLIMFLTSCNADHLKKTPNDNKNASMVSDQLEEGSGPSESMFSIEITIPEELAAERSFDVKGFLINTSNKSWNISHGADMFTYSLYNDDEELVPRKEKMIAVNDIGIGTILKPNSKYNYDGEDHVSVKLYELTVKEPGEYKIVGEAKFRINYNNRVYEFLIKSKPYEVKIS